MLPNGDWSAIVRGMNVTPTCIGSSSAKYQFSRRTTLLEAGSTPSRSTISGGGKTRSMLVQRAEGSRSWARTSAWER